MIALHISRGVVRTATFQYGKFSQISCQPGAARKLNNQIGLNNNNFFPRVPARFIHEGSPRNRPSDRVAGATIRERFYGAPANRRFSIPNKPSEGSNHPRGQIFA
jgi:hypothetical protein